MPGTPGLRLFISFRQATLGSRGPGVPPEISRRRHQAPVASVAMVSNAVNHAGAQFDTGSQEDGLRVLKGIARAARSLFAIA